MFSLPTHSTAPLDGLPTDNKFLFDNSRFTGFPFKHAQRQIFVPSHKILSSRPCLMCSILAKKHTVYRWLECALAFNAFFKYVYVCNDCCYSHVNCTASKLQYTDTYFSLFASIIPLHTVNDSHTQTSNRITSKKPFYFIHFEWNFLKNNPIFLCFIIHLSMWKLSIINFVLLIKTRRIDLKLWKWWKFHRFSI